MDKVELEDDRPVAGLSEGLSAAGDGLHGTTPDDIVGAGTGKSSSAMGKLEAIKLDEAAKQASHKRDTEKDLNQKAYGLAFATLGVIVLMYIVDSISGRSIAENLFAHLFGVLTLIIGFLFGAAKRQG